MKLKFVALVFLSSALFVRGQGTFVWDQGFTNITDAIARLTNQPAGQPFTPTMSSMDAAAFYLNSGVFGSPGGDVIEVNVHSGSITGAILGTSDPDTLSAGGVYYFTFSTPIALTPGTKYYLQPFEVSGNTTIAQLCNAQNLTGQAIVGGTVEPSFNFFFQEGVEVVPEPSFAVLFIIGGGTAYWHRRKRRIT